MVEDRLDGFLFWLQASSISIYTIFLSLNFFIVIHVQASDYAALIVWMADIGRGIIGENSSHYCVSRWDWLQGWKRGMRVRMECYKRMLHTVSQNKEHLTYLRDNLVCKMTVQECLWQYNSGSLSYVWVLRGVEGKILWELVTWFFFLLNWISCFDLFLTKITS